LICEHVLGAYVAMEIEFDPDKEATNLAKHKDFAEASGAVSRSNRPMGRTKSRGAAVLSRRS
jgi:uncharacterized DUF497 family protein